MKKKRNIIIGLIACVLLITTVFFVFNRGKSNEQVVTEYFELLKKKDYKQMYQMLDQKTVYTPTQIYFVEKNNKTGVTDLYSLDEFSPRKTENIRKGYMQGRYGAIPIIDLEANLWEVE